MAPETPDVDALRQVVIDTIARVAPDTDPASIPGDAYLGDELEIDSMDMLNIAAAIYERTGIDIPERDYSELSTLDAFTRYLVLRSSGPSVAGG